MNHPEKVCCTAMRGQCGAMMKQNCCRTISKTQSPLLAAQSPNLEIHWIALTQVDLSPNSKPMQVSVWGLTPEADSPPGRPLSRTTILRI